MEETHENKNLINGVDLDELVNKLPSKIHSEPEQQLPNEPKSFKFKTDSLVFHFLCVFGVVFLSIFFVFQVYLTPITVVGESMLPTINSKTTSTTDTSHSDVVYYRAKENYTYGDIVIVSNKSSQYVDNTNQTHPVEYLIKRVIACPGDTITFYLDYSTLDGKYFYKTIVKDRNGNEVEIDEDSYIKEQMVFNSYTFYTGNLGKIAKAIRDASIGYYEIKISENCYYVMGDNRNNSSDSRTFGEVSKNDICGNVRLQVVYGENVWTAIFKKIKSYMSATFLNLKENL